MRSSGRRCTNCRPGTDSSRGHCLLRMIAKVITKKLKKHYRPRTLRRLLRRMGFSYVKPRTVLQVRLQKGARRVYAVVQTDGQGKICRGLRYWHKTRQACSWKPAAGTAGGSGPTGARSAPDSPPKRQESSERLALTVHAKVVDSINADTL